MMSDWILFNGSLRKSSEPAIFHNNESYLYGVGVFSTILWDGEVLRDFSKHLNRLKLSVRDLFKGELDISDLEAKIKSLIIANEITGSARVRINLSQRSGGIDSLVTAVTYKAEFSDVKLQVSQFKVNAYDALSGHKSSSYANYLLALRRAKSKGADEALLLNTDNYLCEGSTTNVYFIKNETLYTPSLATGCLPGIVRSNILESSSALGFEVQEGEFTLDDLKQADVVFVSNSLRRLRRVSELEGIALDKVQSKLANLLIETHGN